MSDRPTEIGRGAWFATFVLICMGASYWFIRVRTGAPVAAPAEVLMLVQVFLLWPLVFFVFVYPEKRKAKQVLLPVLAGMLFGSLVLLEEQKFVWHYIDMLRWVLVVLFAAGELWVLLLLLRSLARLRRSATPDDDIAEVMSRAMGDSVATRLMTAELLMWYYALLSYGQRVRQYQGTHHFHSDLHEGNSSNQIAFLVIIAVETPVAHFLLAMWHPTVALVASVLSIYGFFWLLGEYRASRLRPVSFDQHTLYLRMGVVGNERVALADIASVEPCNERVRRRPGWLRRVPPGTQANVCITLRQPTVIGTAFGAGTYTVIALAVNEPARFIDSLRNHIP